MIAECEICLENYDDHKHLPRVLDCNHHLCTSCIIQLIGQGPLKCPFCRALHRTRIICPSDVPLHNALVEALLMAKTQKSEGDTDTSPPAAPELSVLKLREAVRQACVSGHGAWAMLTTDEGVHRRARLSIANDRLHLHALQDGDPPEESYTVSYGSVRGLLEDEHYVITFMELKWGECIRGHLYIMLLDKAGRTRQFLYFCSGERGPSYANTRLLEVIRKGSPGEQVWGGDFERNDGSGGSALSGMVRGEPHHVTIVPGLIGGFYYNGYGVDHNPSQFGIYLRDMCGYVEISSLGMVVEGLELLHSAVNLDSIRDVWVSDCGVLLCH